MKIKIFYNFDIIFSYPAVAWNHYFNSNGHESILASIRPDTPDPYQQSVFADINLFIGNPMMFRLIEIIGYPDNGKNILWVLDPLTHASSYHTEKLQALESIEMHFDAIACMDSGILSYFAQHYPALPLAEIPYVLEESRILRPMEEKDKIVDVLMLGRRTFKRDAVVESVRAAGLNIIYMHGQCWGEKRKKILHNSKICLQMPMDDYTYFDQFRIFESIAHGALVLGPVLPDTEKYGFANGHNLVQCHESEIPRFCADLLQNDNYRRKIIDNAQVHVRERFTTPALGREMLALWQKVV